MEGRRRIPPMWVCVGLGVGRIGQWPSWRSVPEGAAGHRRLDGLACGMGQARALGRKGSCDQGSGRKAWRQAALPAAERGEHWWPVALAIIAVVGLHVALPAKYRVNPPWVLPVVLFGLLAAIIIADPGRIDRQKPWLRVATSAVIVVLTLANMFAAGRLVGDILTVNKVFANNALVVLC